MDHLSIRIQDALVHHFGQGRVREDGVHQLLLRRLEGEIANKDRRRNGHVLLGRNVANIKLVSGQGADCDPHV